MNRSAIGALCVVVMLGAADAGAGTIGTPGGSYMINAEGRVSQYDLFTVDSFTGTEPVIPLLPEVHVGLSGGAIRVDARSDPFGARSVIVNGGNGIATSTVRATFHDSAIQIEGGPALESLLPPGETTLDLLVNFVASLEPATDASGSLAPLVSVGTSTQTSLDVDASVGTVSHGGGQSRSGTFNVINGSFGSHSFNTGGFFSGLPEAPGGTVTVSVPATISTSAADGLIIGIRGHAEVSGLALSDGFINAEVATRVPNYDPAEVVTLTDGTSLRSLGVGVTLLPVPEPGTLASLTVGLLAMGALGLFTRAWRRRRGSR